MPNTPDPASAAEIAARKSELSNLNPDDIDSEKVDQMVRRLFNTLDHQLTAVEKAKNETNDAAARAADARTLASLQRTMEQLARTERERAAMRNSRASKKNEAVRKEIERKWTRILEIAVAEEILGQPDGSGTPPTLH